VTAGVDLPDFVQSVGGAATKLFQNFVAGSPGNSIPVAGYGSVQVLLLNLDNASNLVVAYEFFDSVSGQIIDVGLLSADANHSIAGDGWPVWELPVRANTLVLINGTAGAPLAIVTGRPETRRKGMANAYYPRRLFSVVVPANTVINTILQLQGQDGNGPVPALRDCSNYNGAMTLFLNASQAITGKYQMSYRDVTGTKREIDTFNNPGATTAQLAIGHPFAYVSWQFQCLAASPASATTVQAILIAAETDG
jgi:hypothetical protein